MVVSFFYEIIGILWGKIAVGTMNHRTANRVVFQNAASNFSPRKRRGILHPAKAGEKRRFFSGEIQWISRELGAFHASPAVGGEPKTEDRPRVIAIREYGKLGAKISAGRDPP
jgi:hypothetical protein